MKVERRHMLLYAVTDRSWLHGQSLVYAVEEVLAGGATMLQLREKHLEHRDFLTQAQELLPLCRKYHVPLIINDDVQVALESGADGVHVGQSDMAVQAARSILGPDKIIGASAHNASEALAAVAAGADYLGCGAVFGSTTKADAGLLSLNTLREIRAAVRVPIVAIGGINRQNIARLAGSGVDGVALISALFAAPDKRAAAQQMLEQSLKIAGGER